MPDIEKISRDDFTHAISVAEEKVDSELSKLKKKLEKKKITSREYVGERMNILKEFVDKRIWFAIFFGFIGVLIILRPGFDVFNFKSLIPLGAAFTFAIYQILTKKTSVN